jgi:hypothetical protein
MAKTNCTNPHGEPTRRSIQTAGKSPASELPATRKLPAARKPAAARKATAASPLHGDSEKFSGERKGPPEAIVPAPEAIVPCGPLPTLWECTPPSSVDLLPFEPIIHTMPTFVAHDFAAGHDFAAFVPRPSRGYPGSNNGEYYEMGGEEGKKGKDYDMAGEEGKNGGEDCDDEDYDSAGSGDDDGDNSRDADFVPKLSESSDDDDFNHLNDDDINEEDRRIKNRDSKTQIPTGRHQGNLIMGGPVAPNYKFMSASEASVARREYQNMRKNYRDGIRREKLRGNKGSSFDELDYTGDLTPTLRPMTLVILACLKLGQTFPENSLVKLRVAEEANHRESTLVFTRAMK